jgi:hypothetical protein
MPWKVTTQLACHVCKIEEGQILCCRAAKGVHKRELSKTASAQQQVRARLNDSCQAAASECEGCHGVGGLKQLPVALPQSPTKARVKDGEGGMELPLGTCSHCNRHVLLFLSRNRRVHYSRGGVQPLATRLYNTVQTIENWNLGPHKVCVKAWPTTMCFSARGSQTGNGLTLLKKSSTACTLSALFCFLVGTNVCIRSTEDLATAQSSSAASLSGYDACAMRLSN